MKKTYVKPQAFFESFELSASIAGNCTFPLHFGENTCTYEIKTTGDIVFILSNLCNTDPDDGIEGMCYHNSVNQFFSS